MSPVIPEFIGLETEYLNAENVPLRRIHLDGAASPLAAKMALDTISEILPHYSNTHSHVHNSAKLSTEAFHWAQAQVLDFLAADAEDYTAVFMGSGTTAAINRVARGLHFCRPERKVVLVSAMEHHANDLPHRQFANEVHYIPLCGEGIDQGAIDLQELERLLISHKGNVNYVTFSAVSNVTGIINPIAPIATLAHKYGALVMVDAAQAVAHQKLEISTLNAEQQPDFFIFSGHKIYCPTAPGVLLARKSLLSEMQGQDLGGGAVLDVSYYDYQLSGLPDREQAGTPNIVGAIALGKVMEQLKRFGRQNIENHAFGLIEELAVTLRSLPHIRVYGDERAPRIGALALTHDHIDHGLLAAILNDYFMIAVRNECFCAHPYVSSLLKEQLWQIDLSGMPASEHESYINRKRGMVRTSLSLYNSSADIERLVQALIQIDQRIETLREEYQALADGNFKHRSYALDWRRELGWGSDEQ